MMAVSLLYALICGTSGKMLEAALQGTAEAIALIVNLGAGYLFFCGMLEIVQALQSGETRTYYPSVTVESGGACMCRQSN